MFFQTENSTFKTAFEFDSSVAAPTEVYLNKDLFYSEGFELAASSASSNELL